MKNKVFFSYSQTNPTHAGRVKEWADALIEEGIEVLIDYYELEPGDDLTFYMERVVADSSISHVVIFCDKSYMAKANARQRGVGVEAQLITSEIYANLEKSKFVPIVCEFENDIPCLPVFMRNRVWIDFSSTDKVKSNWKKLLKWLYGIPQKIRVLDEESPNDGEQILRLDNGYKRIISSLTVKQLSRILSCPKGDASGETKLESLIHDNSERINCRELNSRGEEVGRTVALRVFELYSFLTPIFVEMCGYNIEYMLFDKHKPVYQWSVDASFIEVTEDAYRQIVEQITGLVSLVDKDVKIVGDWIAYLDMPEILDLDWGEEFFDKTEGKRFVPCSPEVLDRQTGERYHPRELFQLCCAEFNYSRLSKEEKIQAYSDLGHKICVAVLQDAFDLLRKPYEARHEVMMFHDAFIKKESPSSCNAEIET